MKGLYISNHNIDDSSSGVSKKIKMQIGAFINMGIDLDAPNLFVDTTIDKIIRRIPFLCNGFNKALKNYLKKNIDKYDFVYIRHPFCDMYFFHLLKLISDKGLAVIYEFPTYPYDRNGKGIKWNLSLLKDKVFRRKIHNYVDRGVNYSGYNNIFNIECFALNNGINPQLYRKRVKTENNDTFVMIGVALLTYWNGYDRVIKGIDTYRKGENIRNIKFHIVGDGDELQHLKQLVTQLALEDEVIFHGFLSGEELDILYDESDVAIGTLSPSRKYKNHVMSSLKTKEYAAKGIPFIKGDKDDVFDREFPDFVFDVKDDESEINIDEISNWYYKLTSNYSIGGLIDHIRDFSFEKLSWEKQLNPVVNYLKSRTDKNENTQKD